ncbi:MAG TPA: DUF4349 domain-containing protein [Trebonia sp.]|nr:DUF4349 domain-containing protein [Trebonia sp.]
MRKTRTAAVAAPRRRLLLLVALPAGLALISMAALAGCSGGSASSAASSAPALGAPDAHAANGAIASPAVAGAASAASGSKSAAGSAGAGQDASAARLAPAGQQLIYTAQLTVRARDVDDAVSQATSIATAAGGYVSSENASSDPAQPSQSLATVTLKIPVVAYPTTLSELSGNALGTRLSLTQQTQDVTQQVADVSSRVASDEAAITQLRALLSRAGSVGDLLSVQNQIDSEESDLEAMQSQQNALNHETAYATVTLTIIGPKAAVKPKPKPAPPPGLVNGLAGGWHALRVGVSWLLAIIGAVAPFAAVVAVAGVAALWARRRLAARASRAAGSAGADG